MCAGVFFCALIKCAFIYLALTIPLVILPICLLLQKTIYHALVLWQEIEHANGHYPLRDNDFLIIDSGAYVCSFITLYFVAKIFGIFKKLDKLHWFFALVIVCIISYLLVLIGKIDFLVDKTTYEAGIKYGYIMYFLIPAFLLYKFFGYLTYKFPKPFKKIGYYTSIEFVKDLYFKIKNK